jgi:release factor glutamine methyltransferase
MKPRNRVRPKNEVGGLLNRLRQRLTGASETPGSDSMALLAHVIGRDRAWLLAHPEADLSPAQSEQIEQAAHRLEGGEPLPYLLGHWEFFGLDFEVSPAVMIPRPETELLVETALEWLRSHPAARLAADVGTGSGCIAIAIAVARAAFSAGAGNRTILHVTAGDISRPALQVAQRNARRHQVGNLVHFFQGELLAPAAGPFDLVCANLPYIPTATLHGLAVAAHEPRLALDGGPEGLTLVDRLLDQLPTRLAPGGLALLEIEATRGAAAISHARETFPRAKTGLLKDLNGLDRLVRIENT